MTTQELVALALQEDLPHGDLTTDALNFQNKKGHAQLVAKQNLVLSGCEPFELAFHLIDPQTKLDWKYKDGDVIAKGSDVCFLSGDFTHLLKSERVALNFLGHLSGIATLTSQFVQQTKGTKTKIIDTRKTTPGLRTLEKRAVLHGGGGNHRLNLSDGILLKENHLRAAGGILAAVKSMRTAYGDRPLEVEVTNLDEVSLALQAGADRLLLDNMSLTAMEEAVKLVGQRAKTEASGNMTLDRIQSVAKLGVDFISVGVLTHSAPTADLSLLFDPVF